MRTKTLYDGSSWFNILQAFPMSSIFSVMWWFAAEFKPLVAFNGYHSTAILVLPLNIYLNKKRII
jgi:hypothetical protein